MFFSLYRNDVENEGGGEESKKCEKTNCTHLAHLSSPGRWTGNNIIFKGGLKMSCEVISF